MTLSNAAEAEKGNYAKLPRRDWLLLPALCFLTVFLLAGSCELISRWVFITLNTHMEDCMVFNDPKSPTRGIPGCVSWGKSLEETLPVKYQFNHNGYRSNVEFGPKSSSTYRIVMVGSSFNFGYAVQAERSYAALLPSELSQLTGRSVELYNESMAGEGGGPHAVAMRFNDALAVNPDMILWVLTPWDINQGEAIKPPESQARIREGALMRKWHAIHDAFTTMSGMDAIAKILGETRAANVLRYYLYQSQSLYVKTVQQENAEEGMLFLRSALNIYWQSHLQIADAYFADITARSKAAGVPLVVVLVPNRAQAAMVSMGQWPAGYDPYKLDDELRTLIKRHGGIYVDILPDYRNLPNPEKGYFSVDGHPNGNGHTTISRLLAKELTNGAVPALRAATRSQTASEQGK